MADVIRREAFSTSNGVIAAQLILQLRTIQEKSGTCRANLPTLKV